LPNEGKGWGAGARVVFEAFAETNQGGLSGLVSVLVGLGIPDDRLLHVFADAGAGFVGAAEVASESRGLAVACK
jgi:hypothetical protein